MGHAFYLLLRGGNLLEYLVNTLTSDGNEQVSVLPF